MNREDLDIDRRMQAILDAAYEDEFDGDHCEICGRRLLKRRYLDGDDADGNRGVWVTEMYCKHCD